MISRRRFLCFVSASMASITTMLPGCTNLKQPLAPLPATKTFSFDSFVQLSKTLTKSDSLDHDVSRKIYQLIKNEPWGLQHSQQVYSRVYELQNNRASLNEILRPENFSTSQTWFISHLLITWYLGEYFHQRGHQHVSWQHALMFKKLKHIKSAPGYCNGDYGFWSAPPQTSAL